MGKAMANGVAYRIEGLAATGSFLAGSAQCEGPIDPLKMIQRGLPRFYARRDRAETANYP